MNKIQLFFLLRKNTKLSTKRHPMFEANQYGKFFGYIMVSILAIEFIALGTFLGWLAAKEDVQALLFYGMPIILIFDFGMRFMTQQTPLMLVKPYLLTPISKYAAIDCFLVKQVLDGGNLFWMVLFLPYVFIVWCGGVTTWAAIGMLILFHLAIVVNSQWYLLIRTLVNQSMWWWMLPGVFYGVQLLPLFILPDSMADKLLDVIGNFLEAYAFSWWAFLFFALLFYFLFLGGETRYILETGFQSMGNLVQNFVGLATYMDPLRETSFAQNWTIYYWAYWIVWCCATPFFIALISKGRTIKNMVLGSYGWGLAGTFMSFIIIGNYGLAQELKHGVNVSGFIGEGGSMYDAILKIFDTLPLPMLALIMLVITMIAFYSTTLDGITYVASSYSYKHLSADKEPDRKVRTFWSILLILFPIALLFAENSLYSIQSVTIIAAFPVVILSILCTVSFFKDANAYIKE